MVLRKRKDWTNLERYNGEYALFFFSFCTNESIHCILYSAHSFEYKFNMREDHDWTLI